MGKLDDEDGVEVSGFAAEQDVHHFGALLHSRLLVFDLSIHERRNQRQLRVRRQNELRHFAELLQSSYRLWVRKPSDLRRRKRTDSDPVAV